MITSPTPTEQAVERFSWRELSAPIGAGAVIGLLLCLVYWGKPQVWLMPIAALLAVIGAVIDWRTHRIPNVLTGGTALATGFVAGLLVAAGELSANRIVLGAVLMAGPLLASHLLTRSRMPGLGDVKLAGVLGCLLGAVAPAAAYLALLASLFVGACFGAAYGRHTREKAFPLGPAISVATVAVLIIFGLTQPNGGWWS